MSAENPIHIPEPKVEVIAERRKTKSRKRFERIPSGVEGVGIITEPGTQPHFNKRQVRRLQADTDRIVHSKKAADIATKAKDRLVQATREQEGFRGIVSSRGNYDAPLVPSETVIYDPELLKKSTGEFHKSLVREEGRVVIDLPFGTDDDSRQKLSDFTQAVTRLASEVLGRDAQEVEALITPTIIQRLDEERLNELITAEQVSLLPGTKETSLAWSTQVKPIQKATTPRRQKPLVPES